MSAPDDETPAVALASFFLLNSTLRHLLRRRLISQADAVMIVGDALYALTESGAPQAIAIVASEQMMATLREVGGLDPIPSPAANDPPNDTQEA